MMIHHSVGNRTVEILIHSGSGQKGVRGGGMKGFRKTRHSRSWMWSEGTKKNKNKKIKNKK